MFVRQQLRTLFRVIVSSFRTHRLIALGSLFAVALLIPVSANNSTAGTSARAVWFADHGAAYRIDPVTHQIAATLPLSEEATDLAVDPNSDILWVLTHKHLWKFDAGTNLLWDGDLGGLTPEIEDPDFITVNAFDSSIAVVAKKGLLYLAADHRMRFFWQAPKQIDAVAIDYDESLWVLAADRMYRLAPNGTVMSDQDATPVLSGVARLSLDSLGGVMWLANKRQVLRRDLTNPAALPVTIGNAAADDIEKMVVEALSGELWVATKNNLMRYDRGGNLLNTIDLRPLGLVDVEGLSVDSFTHTAWVAGKQKVVHLTADGVLLGNTDGKSELEAVSAAGGNIFPAPTVSVLTPFANQLTNIPNPVIEIRFGASCGGTPCDAGAVYYRNFNLDVLLNGVQVGGQFAVHGDVADYTSASRLPEGRNTLVVRALDIYGHLSAPVTSQFTIDTIAPVFVSLTPSDQTIVTVPQATLSGTLDDATATVMLENMATLGGSVITQAPPNFAFTVPLRPGANAFTLDARDPAGNITRVTRTVIYQQPIVLAITSPINGETASGMSISVTGTLSAPIGTTVSVNGTAGVWNADGTFVVGPIALVPGRNTLNIIATSPDGRNQTITRTVFAAAAGWGPTLQLVGGIPWKGTSDPRYASIGSVNAVMTQCGNALAIWDQVDVNDTSYYPAHSVWLDRFVVGGGWASPFRLSNGSVTGSSSRVTTNGLGSAMVTWGSSTGIYTRRQDTDGLWKEQEIAGGGWDPDIAMNAAGEAVLGYNAGYYGVDIWTAMYSPTQGWRGHEKMPQDWNAKEKVRVVRDNRGHALALWKRYEGGWSGYGLWASDYDSVSGWRAPRKLNIPLNDYYRTNVVGSYDVAMSTNGDAVIVWSQPIEATYVQYGYNTNKFAVHAVYYSPATGWGAASVIGNDGNRNVNPAVAIDADGNALASWITGLTANNGEEYGYPLWGRRYQPGSGWKEVERLDPGSTAYKYKPRIALTTGGGAIVAWSARPNYSWGAVMAQRYDPMAGWSSPTQLGWGNTPGLAADSCGNAVAVWASSTAIWAATYTQTVSGAAPKVIPPPDITVEATGALTPVNLGQAQAFDDLDGALTATPDKTGPFALGGQYILWKATNSRGGTGTALQTVVVQDTTPPKFTAPPAVTHDVSDPNNVPAVVNLGTPVATDLFAPVAIVNDAPALFPLGTTLVTWTATDPSGNKTTATQTVTVRYAGDLYVHIDNPALNASVAGGAISVSGTLRAPPNTGVTVNGAVAEIVGDKFHAGSVSLAPDNQLTAIATTQDGRMLTHTIQVVPGSLPVFSMNLSADAGIAPFIATMTESLRVVNGVDASWVQRVEADFNGDGIIDATAPNLDTPLKYTYSTPGVYTARATVVLYGGTVLTDTRTVVAQNFADRDTLLRGIYSGMLDQLRVANIDGALTAVSGGMRAKYQAVFMALQPNLPTVVDRLGILQGGVLGHELAEYTVLRNQNGSSRAFLIYFLRSEDGVWRIDGM